MNDLMNLKGVDVPPEVLRLVNDESTSDWLRAALWKSLTRDPLDALNDAQALAGAVEAWTRRVFLAAGYEMPAADL